MFQYVAKNNVKTGKQQDNKKRSVQMKRPVIQMCDTGADKFDPRNNVKIFFKGLKDDKNPEKNLYVYSHVHSDGLGDAGQLKLLYDKVNNTKTKLDLKNISMFCTYSIGDQIQHWKNDHQEEGEEAIPWEDIINKREEAIRKVCDVPEKNIKLATTVDHIRENAFNEMPDWEVEYPVPDREFQFPDNKAKQLLKIKEMGATDLELTNIKAGDTLFGGIGYGIPDKVDKLDADNSKSAESFLKRKTGESNVEGLLNKAWIVSVKNYIFKSDCGDKYASFPKERMNDIVEKAKAYGAKLIIFAGMPKMQMNGDEYQKRGILWWKIHIICSDIEHDTLRDLMSKITNGVIISGGEGLFAESLSTPDPKTASVLAARYGFQYQEIAYCLLLSAERYYADYNDLSTAIEKYRIFYIDNNFYYAENENKFIEILEESVKNSSPPKKKLQGEKIYFSKNLSALWLPLSINSNLLIQRPTVFKGMEDTLEVFKTQKQRLANMSWFALIDT